MGNTFYPLTHAQRRIWYTEKFYPGTSVSNLSGFGKLKSASGIDSGLLTEAIRKFVRTNDTMRFRLMFEGEDEPKQYIAEDEPFQIEYLDGCGGSFLHPDRMEELSGRSYFHTRSSRSAAVWR